MIRRRPVRIELKLEDLDEWEDRKLELKIQQGLNKLPPSDSSSTPDLSNKLKKDLVRERIGYNPEPLQAPARTPIH